MGQRARAVRSRPGAENTPGDAAASHAPVEPTESAAATSRRRRMARLLALGGLRAATVQAATEAKQQLHAGEDDAKLDR